MEQNPKSVEAKKCEHPACNCTVTDGNKYCSRVLPRCPEHVGTILQLWAPWLRGGARTPGLDEGGAP